MIEEKLEQETITKPLTSPFKNLNRILLAVVAVSLLAGVGSGFFLVKQKPLETLSPLSEGKTPDTPQQDTRTFRDFAEGTIQKRPAPKNEGEYVEGTHFLVREAAVPVALTSSVVDLSLYEGKGVKVFGETQKAIKEGWLMDVGKVEVKN